MARIVVLGGVASDEVIHLTGRCREGAHLDGRLARARLGGGGANTAVALAAAGHQVTLVTAVGEDAAADWQLARLAERGVDTSAIVRVPGPSTRSILLVDPEGERTIVNLGRAQEAEPPHRLLDLSADLVYVRSRKLGLAPLLKQVRAPVVAHIPPAAPGLFPAGIVLASQSDIAVDDPLALARQVAGERLQWMVLTRGAAGVRAFADGGGVLEVPAVPVAPVDSTGAGDSFAAGLCHALAGGLAMAAALREAVRWGAAKVGEEGSALSVESVRRLLK
ncbi:MAG TPA: PfkB family carbohydrate kinase [Magnetospirillum sp.]|jgi:sugar/nucleoside kinase (ribokinase family)|nr:PfkB family carbohydrate kinase [Magnetospirillum sp.]